MDGVYLIFRALDFLIVLYLLIKIVFGLTKVLNNQSYSHNNLVKRMGKLEDEINSVDSVISGIDGRIR